MRATGGWPRPSTRCHSIPCRHAPGNTGWPRVEFRWWLACEPICSPPLSNDAAVGKQGGGCVVRESRKSQNIHGSPLFLPRRREVTRSLLGESVRVHAPGVGFYFSLR